MALPAVASQHLVTKLFIRDAVKPTKVSGTQLIQELRQEGVHAVTSYDPKGLDKIMRLHSVTNTIENGFVYVPEKAEWLAAYMHEVTAFPNGKHDDQTDSTSQALDWVKQSLVEDGFFRWLRLEHEKHQAEIQSCRYEGPNFKNIHLWDPNWRSRIRRF